ncbi:MAG: hypothetical protein HY000_07610 [Planctomycetes bacterium]|nr:hypothetical protein [Planctomycetota bacterium]
MSSICLINPRYESLVRRHGLDQFDRVMHWQGGRRMVSHPSRDVTQIDIEDAGETVRFYVKREWQTYAKDRVTGWLHDRGWGTKARHEWRLLGAMAAAGVGCAEPVVMVERGWIRRQGYLIVRAIPGAVELNHYLAEHRPVMSVRDRRQFAAYLGREVARLHEAGIDHPDLYSKHILLGEGPQSSLPLVSFIDMQRSSAERSVSASRRARDLAALDATLSRELASATDRAAFLGSYLSHTSVRLDQAQATKAIRRRAFELLRRRNIREMQGDVKHAAGQFVQLNAEATLYAESNWIELLRRAGLDGFDQIMATNRGQLLRRQANCEIVRIELPTTDGPVRLCLERYRGRYPLARLRQRILGRRVQLPGWSEAAQIGRMRRLGLPAPDLLAFGQRFGRWAWGESFVLTREVQFRSSKLLP